MSLLLITGLLSAVWWSLSPTEQARLLSAWQQQFQPPPAVVAPVGQPAAPPVYRREEFKPAPGSCIPRQVTAEPETVPGVYRWQDVNGRWHYADKYPVGAAKVEDLSANFQPDVRHVDIHVQGDVTGWAGSLQSQLTLDAEKAFRLYAHYLPSADARRIQVTVNAFSSRDRFVAWRESRDKSSAANAGIYDVLGREVGVLLMGDREWDAGLIRHEVAHAIHHELLAQPPVWFDEGMAEVFNAISYRDGQWRLVGIQEPHLKLLRAAGPQDVVKELARRDWPGDDPLLSYARAWSMAAFFLSTHPALFGAYVQWLDAHYCERVDSQAFMAEHYPGGLPQWQSDWQQWLDTQLQPTSQQPGLQQAASWWEAIPAG